MNYYHSKKLKSTANGLLGTGEAHTSISSVTMSHSLMSASNAWLCGGLACWQTQTQTQERQPARQPAREKRIDIANKATKHKQTFSCPRARGLQLERVVFLVRRVACEIDEALVICAHPHVRAAVL